MKLNLDINIGFNRNKSAEAVDRAMSRTILADTVINDAYVKRHGSYYDQGQDYGLPSKNFWLWRYTSGASLFQIRSSRHYSIENDYAGHYYELLASNVLGVAGMQLEADPVVADAWGEWGNFADITGEMDFAQLMEEMLLNPARDGELMIGLVVEGGDLRLQIIDVELVARGLTVPGRRIYDGVQFDEAMRPRGYYLRTGPVSASGTSLDAEHLDFIPAQRVIRGWRRKFPGQTHGIPWLYSPVRSLDLLSDFDLAVIQRAKNSVPLLGYFETPMEYATEDRAMSFSSGLTEMDPSQVMERPEGTTFRRVDFSFPEQAYTTYRQGMLYNATAGANTSYFSLTGDLQGANYSSIRQVKIDEARQYGRIQTWYCGILNRVFAAWVGHYSRGGATMGLRRRLDIQKAPAWTGPGVSYIDPSKEQQGNESMLRNRLIAPSDIIKQRGQNPDQVFERIRDDIKKMNDLGIPLPEAYTMKALTAPEPVEEDDPDKEDEDE